MTYLVLIPILGLVMLALLALTNLMGLKVIKAKLAVHRRLSYLLMLFVLAHGVYGWVYFNPADPIGTLMGTILFLLILLNILSGTRKIKLNIKLHRGLGYASIAVGLLHAVIGFLKTFGFVSF